MKVGISLDTALRYDPREGRNDFLTNKKLRVMIITANEQTFTSEVLDASTPVLVNFWAPWCGLCRMIDPTLDRLHQQWGDRLKLVNVNADENFKISNTYKLKSLPTLMLFERGQVYHRLEKFHSMDDLRRAAGDLNIALEEMTMSLSR